MEDGPPMFKQNFTCSALLEYLPKAFPVQGYHFLRRSFPASSGKLKASHWPSPRSLAATNGVSVDFLSSGYLDVSVRRVRSRLRERPKKGGFPHSDIPGSKFTGNSPRLFAACHVLHRLSTPRHPPDALRRLISLPANRAKTLLKRIKYG